MSVFRTPDADWLMGNCDVKSYGLTKDDVGKTVINSLFALVSDFRHLTLSYFDFHVPIGDGKVPVWLLPA